MEKVSGIYRILNLISGKCYIGRSKNIYTRWAGHRTELRRGRHHSRYLQNAWRRYGEGAFLFEILEIVEPELLIAREQYFMDTLMPEYNRWLRSTGGHSGDKFSDESRARMSAAHKGMKQTQEWAQKRTRAWVGRKHTEETRAKMRKPKSGRVPMTEEHKQRIAAALRGKPKTPEHRAHLSQAGLRHRSIPQ